MKKKTVQRIVYSVLTAALLVFIFGNSSADGEASSELSLMVLGWANGLLEALKLPITLSHHFIRKLAHFTEYSLLGALLTATTASWRRRQWCFRSVWIALVFGSTTASLDEYLQTFVSGRHGSPLDVLLDFSGVLWAALAVSALLTRRVIQSGKDKPSD